MTAQTSVPREEPVSERSTRQLIGDLTNEIRRLVRIELRLAQRELRMRGKQAGKGTVLLLIAGFLGLLGSATLTATVVLALNLVLPAWLAALIVGAALVLVAGTAALVGGLLVRRSASGETTLDTSKQHFQEVWEAGRT